MLDHLQHPFGNQGQAHIVSTAIASPRSCKASREVEATPWFRTWFSIDPQPASISPTINISIVFIFLSGIQSQSAVCHKACRMRFIDAVLAKLGVTVRLGESQGFFRESK
jgi:hypothetical protein